MFAEVMTPEGMSAPFVADAAELLGITENVAPRKLTKPKRSSVSSQVNSQTSIGFHCRYCCLLGNMLIIEL